MENFLDLAKQLGEKLQKQQNYLAIAESCTGGQVSYILTSIPGSSNWFERGFVTYSNEAKQEMLGVSAEMIEQQGAVSEVIAKAMAQGAIANSHADISVAITGIAGPDGGSDSKPIGTVWIAWALNNQATQAQCFHFTGGRIAVRTQAAEEALKGLLKVLN